MKQAEDGEELIVRLVEVEGEEKTLSLSLPESIKAVRRLNLVEHPITGVAEATVNENKLSVSIKPHEIVTLGIKLNK